MRKRKRFLSFLVSTLFLFQTGPAFAGEITPDGIAVIEFIVRHNARARLSRDASEAGYIKRLLQNAKITGTVTEKYFNGSDKNTTDYTTTTDTTQAGTTAAITLSIPLMDFRDVRDRDREMLQTIQSIREGAQSAFSQLREKQASARDQGARLKEFTAYIAWLHQRVDAGVDYRKEMYKEKLVLMREQETLDITNAQISTLIDSLLGMVDEGSRPQLRIMLKERW